MDNANDNFGLLVRNPRWADVILNRFRCEARLRELTDDRNDKPVDSSTEANGKDRDKNKTEDQRKYVQHRLREISSWELRVNGGKKS